MINLPINLASSYKVFIFTSESILKDMDYYIKITGEGTKEEIVNALQRLSNDIRISSDDELDGAKWEHEILFTEINHD